MNTSHGNEVHHNILHISNKDHVTNQEVHAKIQQAIILTTQRPPDHHLWLTGLKAPTN